MCKCFRRSQCPSWMQSAVNAVQSWTMSIRGFRCPGVGGDLKAHLLNPLPDNSYQHIALLLYASTLLPDHNTSTLPAHCSSVTFLHCQITIDQPSHHNHLTMSPFTINYLLLQLLLPTMIIDKQKCDAKKSSMFSKFPCLIKPKIVIT